MRRNRTQRWRSLVWCLLGVACLVPAACSSDRPAPARDGEEATERWAAANRPEGEQGGTVPLHSIPVLQTVLWESPNFEIDPVVEIDGYYYRFRVTSAHGEYRVTSVRKLIKRLHEIDVIEHFRENDEGGHILKGVGQSVVGVGKGLGNAVRHPGQTVKRIGQGTGRFFRAVGGIFAKPFRDEERLLASDGTDLALLGKGPGGGERRLLAAELGLDVYTQNPHAQGLLKEVARQRMMGKLPVGAAVFALPGGAVFTLSLTPMGYEAATEDLIRIHSPAELKRELGIRYQKQFGLDYTDPDSAVARLLANPNYSPREQAYLWRYLTDLEELDGTADAFAFLAGVSTPAQASIVSTQVELLSLLHQRKVPLDRFVPVHNTLGGRGRNGRLCLVISIDTVRYQGDVSKSLQRSINAARRVEAESIAIYSTGDIDRRSVQLAERMGVRVFQNILDDPVFRVPRDESDPTLWTAMQKGEMAGEETGLETPSVETAHRRGGEMSPLSVPVPAARSRAAAAAEEEPAAPPASAEPVEPVRPARAEEAPETIALEPVSAAESLAGPPAERTAPAPPEAAAPSAATAEGPAAPSVPEPADEEAAAPTAPTVGTPEFSLTVPVPKSRAPREE
jgi:hypothetical protein